MYAMRVDLDLVDDPELKEWFSTLGSFFSVRETIAGENPHVHVFIRSTKKMHAIRESFKRKFQGCVGNRGYSLKVCTEADMYCQYMCKGEAEGVQPEVYSKQGIEFTDEWVMERHSAYWDLNLQLKNKHKKAAKKMQPTIIEQVVSAAKKKNVKWQDERELGKIYLQVCRVSVKSVNPSLMKSVIDGVKLQLCPDDSAVEAILDRNFPFY